jgi:hypothetical protein
MSLQKCLTCAMPVTNRLMGFCFGRFFHIVDFFDGSCVEACSGKAVDGLRGHGYEAALLDDLRGGTHVCAGKK